MSVLDWLLHDVVGVNAQGSWFDPRKFAPPSLGLQESVRRALQFHPCEILFVHRDSEGQPPTTRYDEIQGAVEEAVPAPERVPYVCVVPVRMTEAWLLFDETAIRRAAGNPNGRMPLELPPVAKAEELPDPKFLLVRAFRTASGQSGRRLKKLNVQARRTRLAELITDFSPLRQLPAFSRLEEDLRLAATDLWSAS